MTIAILGECMLEFSRQDTGDYRLSFGGDTLNTALYLARNGGACDYFTAVGDDPFSLNMINDWESEGIGVNHVKIKKNQTSGLYIIQNDNSGERTFHYWRSASPARSYLSDFPIVLDELKKYPMIFLTGITLAIYSEQVRKTLFAFLTRYRKLGGIVIFDNNFRANNWESKSVAKQVYKKMMNLTDVALLSFDDEIQMHGEHSIEKCLAQWLSAGVREVIIKRGSKDCLGYKDGDTTFVPTDLVEHPIDTTAAGDAFNGAYLAAKQAGQSLVEGIKNANYCSSVVIMNKGAIIDENINIRRCKS